MPAALHFEPDIYAPQPGRIMGRHAAGGGFLRAVAEAATAPVIGHGPGRAGEATFAALVAAHNPAAVTRWIPAEQPDALAAAGTLHLAGPVLDRFARMRLRRGPAAFSLTGVIHTSASHTAMDAITGLLSAPVMPWDALISTSSAVGGTVKAILEAEQDYLKWRFGAEAGFTLPLLPVIPLGTHCDDYCFEPGERTAARAALDLAENEVAVLYVGRLSQHAKAHPYQMYRALEAAAIATGAKLSLVQCGWFHNAAVETSFKSGADLACPSVRCLYPPGTEPESLRRAWASADIFVSLSDNIQETFGLTPVEAMAAGLPVVVTDWDGYRDTVRDGVDGFRIPTWTLPSGAGDGFAQAYETGGFSYDRYCGLLCQTVSVDMAALIARLSELVSNRNLRSVMGAAGRQRARAFDWSQVLAQYETLWRTLAKTRTAAVAGGWGERLAQAPRVAAGRLDPFHAFAHYPTAALGPGTFVRPRARGEARRYSELVDHPMFAYAGAVMPTPQLATALLAALGSGRSVAELAGNVGIDLGPCLMAVAVLAKVGLVEPIP